MGVVCWLWWRAPTMEPRNTGVLLRTTQEWGIGRLHRRSLYGRSSGCEHPWEGSSGWHWHSIGHSYRSVVPLHSCLYQERFDISLEMPTGGGFATSMGLRHWVLDMVWLLTTIHIHSGFHPLSIAQSGSNYWSSCFHLLSGEIKGMVIVLSFFSAEDLM